MCGILESIKRAFDMRYDFPMVLAIAGGRLFNVFARGFRCAKTAFLFWFWGVKVGRNVRMLGAGIIRTRRRGEIILHDGVILNSCVNSNPVGLTNPTILDTLFGGKIEIFENTGASSVVISSASSVKIGRHCMIGGNVRIFDHDFHPLEWEARRPPQDMSRLRKRSVEIGDDCFIGTNAIILKGTKLGNRTIVAAGSVVFGLEAPEGSLVRGNPARVVS